MLNPTSRWSPTDYAKNAAFVPELGRAVVELLAHLDGEGQHLAWPVAVVAESPDELSVVFRTYCSQWPVDGRRHLRPPILEPGTASPGDVVGRYQAALEHRRTGYSIVGEDGIDHELVRRVAEREVAEGSESRASGEGAGDNVFTMVRKIGQAKAELATDYAVQLARSAGKVVFFAKHLDVMDTAEEIFSRRGVGATSIRGDQTRKARDEAIDRVHRIGQTEPVTAWRIIAAQTIDAKIAELIDSKAGLAARALDGAAEEASTVDVQVETLVAILTEALSEDVEE